MEKNGVPNARKNAEWMLASALGCSTLELYVDSQRIPDVGEVERYQNYLKRRASREPLQYITGDTAFMALPFKVRAGVFIPRPDTEVLVEKIEKKIIGHAAHLRILDLCCGTGAIAVSLAARLRDTEVIGVDSSEAAVQLAIENASLNNVSHCVRILRADAREFLGSGSEAFHVVVCNPPYVPTGDISQLAPEIRNHEPVGALDGGADGTDLYRMIIPLLPGRIGPGGYAAFEIGPPQRETVETLLEGAGFVEIESHWDYGGRDRVVIGQRPH
ncbi:MAG: peptide chain release factor N(5)-glutamine methyltransferase [Candidatus Latescibacteria bacterium]|nr:peptide chain release factor N(5)-glutamine methyltransferase [Candidatus Latescibacterota bacterium]NIM22584.1 peptide chain release factor N(5)-glutamine methyltransferase [Candidatus Latescibacterota bacterium]NIM64873.1 peptide chain release factor N(5)-glutamine methyltransferase [Candidatus Latescibacterota bacterium]NIO01388.1 peptide chain release factor N(5)-glutamine methyltransferase [Candidatus Latescibacterota bacterium]NIO27898.1 peptide chain release factor N(5)-glutamine meth